MSEPRPFASLTSGLLARKGSAKPAMRPQFFGHVGTNLDDLGWNDHGHDHATPSAPASFPAEVNGEKRDGAAAGVPPVVEQQVAIAETFGKPVEEPDIGKSAADIVSITSRQRREPGAKGKAAFTLRLDPDRHLRLRLACAVQNVSAQQLVTRALDEFLSKIEEVETLAEQLPAAAG